MGSILGEIVQPHQLASWWAVLMNASSRGSTFYFSYALITHIILTSNKYKKLRVAYTVTFVSRFEVHWVLRQHYWFCCLVWPDLYSDKPWWVSRVKGYHQSNSTDKPNYLLYHISFLFCQSTPGLHHHHNDLLWRTPSKVSLQSIMLQMAIKTYTGLSLLFNRCYNSATIRLWLWWQLRIRTRE